VRRLHGGNLNEGSSLECRFGRPTFARLLGEAMHIILRSEDMETANLPSEETHQVRIPVRGLDSPHIENQHLASLKADEEPSCCAALESTYKNEEDLLPAVFFYMLFLVAVLSLFILCFGRLLIMQG